MALDQSQIILAILIVGVFVIFGFSIIRFTSGGKNKLSKNTSPIGSDGLTGTSFHSKVVGVTQPTKNGKDRQAFIKSRLKIGDKLTFVHEYDNRFDPDAIAIYTSSGFHLGYVKRGSFFGVSGESLILENIAAGIKVTGIVKDIRRGEDGVYGVNYEIFL